MADAKGANGTQQGGERRTIVEDGTLFKGALSSTCPIIVRGKVEGELSAPALTISSSGAVHGTVKVGELRSEGELSGEFDADVVQLSGRVRDNTVLRARSLEVKLAPPEGRMQVIFGECALEVGDAPSKEVAASSAASAVSAAGAAGAAGATEPIVPPASVRPPSAREPVEARAAEPEAREPASSRVATLPPHAAEPARASTTTPESSDEQSS